MQWRRQRSKGAGHFEVRKSSSQVNRIHFFPQKKLTTFFNKAARYAGLGRAEPGLEQGGGSSSQVI